MTQTARMVCGSSSARQRLRSCADRCASGDPYCHGLSRRGVAATGWQETASQDAVVWLATFMRDATKRPRDVLTRDANDLAAVDSGGQPTPRRRGGDPSPHGRSLGPWATSVKSEAVFRTELVRWRSILHRKTSTLIGGRPAIERDEHRRARSASWSPVVLPLSCSVHERLTPTRGLASDEPAADRPTRSTDDRRRCDREGPQQRAPRDGPSRTRATVYVLQSTAGGRYNARIRR